MKIKFLYLIICLFLFKFCFAKDKEQLFSPVPLNNLLSISEEVKPNIITLIDNSNFTSPSEVKVLLKALLSDQDIINNQRWGIAYLYNKDDPFFNITINLSLSAISDIIINVTGALGGTLIPVPIAGTLAGAIVSELISLITSGILPDNIKIPINSNYFTNEIYVDDLSNDSHLSKIKSSIQSYNFIGPTSITRKYYNLTKEIRDGKKDTKFGPTILYSCQPNYIVILTRGINRTSLSATSVLDFINGFSQTSKDIADAGESIPFLQNIISLIPGLSLIPNALTIISSIIKSLPEINTAQVNVADDDTFVRNYIYNLNKQYINFDNWDKYGNYGLAFLSENHSNNKITENYPSFNDSIGIKWNNDISPMQTIDTIIIGVNINQNSDQDYSYLENGASYIYGFGGKAFFKVLSSKQFKDLINDPFFPNINESYLSSNPVLISLNNNKKLLLIAEENPKNWSTIMHFKEFNNFKSVYDYINKYSINDFYKDSYLPNYGTLTNNLALSGSSRRFIVSTANAPVQFLDSEAYNDWLMRISNKSDQDLMLRNRCIEDQNNCSKTDPQRMMGDIGSNPILHINDKTKNNSSFIVTAANDGMVHIFKNVSSDDQFQLILNYVPGSLLKNSQPLWNFLPVTAKKNYGKGANNTHQFFLNGAISYYGIAKKNCSSGNICSKFLSELIVAGSAGQGAKGIYVLNIGGNDFKNGNALGLSNSSQDSWIKDIPLWESTSNQFGYNKQNDNNYQEALKLGFVIGSPKIAPITLKRNLNKDVDKYKPDLQSGKYYAAFVNNGLFNEDNIPTLYVFDALGIKSTEVINERGYLSVNSTKNLDDAGKILKKIKVPDDITFGTRQGLAPITLVDTDNDGIADIAYAGDYEGNMYRFDFRKSNVDNWTVTRIYKGAGLDKNSLPIQPITTAPAVYKKDESGYKYVVIFGTGSNLFLDDIKEYYAKYHTQNVSNERFQSVYGIYDDINIEKVNEIEFSNRNNQLTEQKITQTSNIFQNKTSDIRTVENNIISSKKQGWFIDLSAETQSSNNYKSEEKIISDPKIFGDGVFFTTEIYKISNDGNACEKYKSQNENGWIMGLNAINGGILNNKMNLGNVNNENVSGIMLEGKPSPIFFINYRETFNLNKDGVFQNGWEENSMIPSKKSDEGNLLIYDGNNLKMFGERQNYIQSKRISWREIF